LVAEGGIVRGDGDECAFGMSGDYDFTSEPLVRRCARVCDADAECGELERCVNHRCRPNCRVESNACDPPNLCVDFGAYCVNPRRFARIDCDGDMDQDVECSPALVCDAMAIGGCTYPEPGTE
jgi:hypothetical protein